MQSFSEAISGISLTLKSEWIAGAEKKIPENRTRAAGGITDDGNFFVLAGGMNKCKEAVSSVWLYDTRRAQWRTDLPNLISARSSHGCIVARNKIYVIGGHASNRRPLQSVEVLDLKQPKKGWVSLPSMKVARAPIAVERLGNKVYVFGSSNYQNGDLVDYSVECFDIQTNGWVRRPLPKIPRGGYYLGSTIFGNKIGLLRGRTDPSPMIFDGSRWEHHSVAPLIKINRQSNGAHDILGVVHYDNEVEQEDEDEEDEEDPNDKNEHQYEANVDTNAAGAQEAAITAAGSTGKGALAVVGVVVVCGGLIGGGAAYFLNNGSASGSASPTESPFPTLSPILSRTSRPTTDVAPISDETPAPVPIPDETNEAPEGKIDVFRYELDGEIFDFFCFDLIPKPPDSVVVKCETIHAGFECCGVEGEVPNQWTFEPTTQFSCGRISITSLEEAVEDIPSSALIQCQADNYALGRLEYVLPSPAPVPLFSVGGSIPSSPPIAPVPLSFVDGSVLSTPTNPPVPLSLVTGSILSEPFITLPTTAPPENEPSTAPEEPPIEA